MGQVTRARTLVDQLVAEARTPVTLALGHLLTGMLDLDALALGDAREHLEMARFLSAPLLDGRIAGNLAWGRTELALVEGRLDDARTAVDEGIAQVDRTGDEEVLCDLCLLGLRVAADRAATADPRRSVRAKARDATAITRYERRLAQRAAEATDDAWSDARPVARAVSAAWLAERTRLDGASDPAAWAEATERWTAVGRPRHAVLARIRRAEALQARADTRPEAPAVLERALKEAEAVGSRLLADQARTVARRAGISLAVPIEIAPARSSPDGSRSPLDSLTRREREVLDLVAGGSTNGQIGAELYISTKTASVHVSHILAKLGVVTRGEAAAIAHRTGHQRGA
jgi:DNA-binding CsgD family transcriptional regulator